MIEKTPEKTNDHAEFSTDPIFLLGYITAAERGDPSAASHLLRLHLGVLQQNLDDPLNLYMWEVITSILEVRDKRDSELNCQVPPVYKQVELDIRAIPSKTAARLWGQRFLSGCALVPSATPGQTSAQAGLRVNGLHRHQPRPAAHSSS